MSSSPPLPESTDVLIIGAGLAGAATAHALREYGIRALLVENFPAAGHESSSRSAGMIRAHALDEETRRWTEAGAAEHRSGRLASFEPTGSVLIGLGLLPAAQVHDLRRLGGLPGHPHVETPYIQANTGSLGMGVSKAKGMALANRAAGSPRRLLVLTGDGELQEGQFWESLATAAHMKLGEIVAIIDHNKIQSDGWVDGVNGLGDIEAKLRAFGWHVSRCDGHDTAELERTFRALDSSPLSCQRFGGV